MSSTRFLFASILLSPLALAQAPATKAVNGAFGLDFTTQYFLRGIQQENQGIIAQPWIELRYGLYEGTSDLKNLNLTFGQWNSLHDGPTGTGSGGSMWYESDFYIGVSGEVGDRLSCGVTYTSYYGPNGIRNDVEELAFSAGYDDKGVINTFASGLQPGVVLAFELDGQLDGGTPGNTGIYAQLGIKPSFQFGQFTLDVPVTLGVSLKDYYEDAGTNDDEFLGFFDVGAVISTAIPNLPARMGPWHAEAALHWMLLGDSNEDRNAGDTSELILSCGVRTTF
ncbi:MAG TPA: hypothetical protein VFD82_11380 [Planctomycetota bacterium]|nr:hypothetical protein [Planctomycetota bacterium]